MKVLVAEDTPTQAAMIKMGLKRKGHDVVIARDGMEAIEKAYRESPDLIVSDVVMPKLNGYQVCRLLKDDATTASLPVVLLTSLDQRQDMFWGMKSGADKYITKKADIPHLVDEIQAFLDEWYATRNLRSDSRDESPESALDFDVMERVIRLLDRNLFKSTVVNEIQKLVNTLDDYDRTIVSALEILSKVMDFHAGCLLLAGEESPELHFYVNRTVSDVFLGELGEKATEIFNKDLHGRFEGALSRNEIHDPRELMGQEGAHPNEIVAHSWKGLVTKGEASGIVVLASAEEGTFTERTEETFDIISRQMNIVVDYARLYERTKQLSITDGLTKIFNHRYFQEQLRREVNRSIRKGSDLSLILLDIDHFKSFNDTYGHQQGDIVLRELAQVLQGSIRHCDILARYGGEEFAIIMPDCAREVCANAAERLRSVVEKHEIPGQEEVLRVTISMGVSALPDERIETPAELISVADQALYRAKEKGRNRVEW